MRVLAVVAHPDDEVIGCGGTLRRFADEGHTVQTLLPLRRCDPRGRECWGELIDGFRAAGAALGAEAVVLDRLLDETRAETHVHDLHDLILPWVERADLVLTHWTGDTNQAHRGVCRAVEIATRPFRRRKSVYLFEVATSTDQGYGAPFHPSLHVLLNSDQAERKCAAMASYPTETAPGRRPVDLRRKLESRGVEIGAEYAEAFVVARHFIE